MSTMFEILFIPCRFLQDRIGGPSLAISQQRRSRSPRSERSCSADIDCVKMGGVRRFEERRHTDSGDVGRWIPSSKQVSKAKRHPFVAQDSIEEESFVQADNALRKSDQSQASGNQDQEKSRSQKSPRSKNSESFDPKELHSPRIITNSKYPATRSHSAGATCSRNRDAHPKSSTASSKPTRVRRHTDTTLDSPEWVSSVTNFTREDVFQSVEDPEKTNTPSVGSTPTSGVRRSIADHRDHKLQEFSRRTSGVNQRIRDLYDFKVETEWPRKIRHPPRRNIWISNSGSEEDDHRGLPETESKPVAVTEQRRKVSQDLEFNAKTVPRKDGGLQGLGSRKTATQLILDEEEREERLRIFHEKLRFSEDLGQPVDRRERRIRSDDYDSKRSDSSEERVRRTASSEDQPTTPRPRGNFGDVKKPGVYRESWVSYAEIDQMKRKSRVSDASYVSIDVFERGVELPPRRAFSQGDEPTPSSSTPATPPSTPLSKNSPETKNSGGQRVVHQKPERQGSKFKIYLV